MAALFNDTVYVQPLQGDPEAPVNNNNGAGQLDPGVDDVGETSATIKTVLGGTEGTFTDVESTGVEIETNGDVTL